MALDYREIVIRNFWSYVINVRQGLQTYLETIDTESNRPPVFEKDFEYKNILYDPSLGFFKKNRLLRLIDKRERHRWFRSMSSSQALVQSVFGNMLLLNSIQLLTDLMDEEGLPLLGDWRGRKPQVDLEYKVNWLGEPRSTSLDVFFQGRYRVAVECKYSEQDIGKCSRPELNPEHKEYCQGKYAYQQGRGTPCPLTDRGIKYWQYIKDLFKWEGDYLDPCPVRNTYQLVRNVLSAVVNPKGSLRIGEGHAVLIYDKRNPSFQPGGDAYTAFEATKEGLKEKYLLRKCSWQRLMSQLQSKGELAWLINEVGTKYGILPEGSSI